MTELFVFLILMKYTKVQEYIMGMLEMGWFKSGNENKLITEGLFKSNGKK